MDVQHALTQKCYNSFLVQVEMKMQWKILNWECLGLVS